MALAPALLGCGGAARHGPAAAIRATPAGQQRALPHDWLGFNGEALTGPPGLWADKRFVAAVAALHPEALRIFGGTTANFWDWRRGSFVAAGRNVAVPAELLAARPRVSIPLSSWAALVRATAATPVFDLNLVTSTLGQQLAMLRAARGLGMAVTRVELGNELYLPRYRARFADGAAYGRVAARWARAVKHAFPGVRVAAAGFVAERAAVATDARERDWDAGVLRTARGVDALTFHPYFQTGLGAGATVASARAAATALLRPSQHWAAVRATLAKLPAGIGAWLTEYNLFDREAAVHTTWAQGLALSAYTLDILADPRVDQADVHALTASAPFGALLAGRDGLAFGAAGNGAFHPPPGAPPPTPPLALSATGVASLALMAALRGARKARPLAFAGERGAAVLRGALIGAHVIILNLSQRPVRVQVGAGPPRGRYAQLWGAPGTLVAGVESLRRAAGTVSPAGLVLRGYSLTLIG